MVPLAPYTPVGPTQETTIVSKDLNAYITALAGILTSHDQQKGDLANRVEGTLQAVGALAQTTKLDDLQKLELGVAVIQACLAYRQTELIGRGNEARPWPTNRYALKALADLGIEKPTAKAA